MFSGVTCNSLLCAAKVWLIRGEAAASSLIRNIAGRFSHERESEWERALTCLNLHSGRCRWERLSLSPALSCWSTDPQSTPRIASARIYRSFRGVVSSRANEADFKAGVPTSHGGWQFALKRVAAWLCIHRGVPGGTLRTISILASQDRVFGEVIRIV